MNSFLIKQPLRRIRAEVVLPGDKSIAHRSLILSALSQGQTLIKNFPLNKDSLLTLEALKDLGIKIKTNLKSEEISEITVTGKGLYGLEKPKGPIFVGDSGTTLRLLLGVLAGQDFKVRLTAAQSLSRRPMRRVSEPLRLMGATINAGRRDRTQEEYPPLTIHGGNLHPINYRMPIASAQVKSAILLAGLYAEGITKIIEPFSSRDHTERMLKLFKAGIKLKQNTILIKGKAKLVSPKSIYIPGDISSAAFFIVLATILPESKLILKNVSLNPSRTGIIRALKRMGAQIKVTSHQSPVTRYEPMGDLVIKSSRLKGTTVTKKEIPSLIDELPVLMVAACYAKGKSVFKGVSELRVKETDRIRSVSDNLKKMGACIRIVKRGGSEDIIIEGAKFLRGCRLKSFGDHRTAMSMVVAGLAAKGKTYIDDVSCISKSFPDFIKIINKLL